MGETPTQRSSFSPRRLPTLRGEKNRGVASDFPPYILYWIQKATRLSGGLGFPACLWAGAALGSCRAGAQRPGCVSRESQVELREHIDSLAAELCRINEDQKVALDLDPYVKKLLNARRRVVLVNNILQNAQERLRRLNHSVGKETARRKAFLDASSNYPHSSPSK